jgi:hypothetical protein
VRAIYIQPDDKVIVGGDFTSYKGTTCNRIVRLNTNGTIDGTFNIGTGFNGVVRSIIAQVYPSVTGQIYVGGDFTQYNGVAQGKISRIESNGSLGLAAIAGTPAPYVSLINSGEVYAVALSSGGGRIVLGGTFVNSASDVTNILGYDGVAGGFGAAGGGGGGSAKVASYPSKGGRGANGGPGYMILHYFSRFE